MKSDWKFKVIVGLIIAVAAVVIFISPIAYRCSAATVTITVTGKDRVSYGSGENLEHKYLVYTDEETFENTDTLVFWKYNSSDVYGKLKDGKRYRCLVAGWRIAFMSSYRNIITVEEVRE